jgi:PKD repeat protein
LRARSTLADSAKPLLFDGAASSDPDGTISFYAWRFGDGANASGATTSHAYAKPGTFTVQLSVTDNSGSVGMSAQSLAVASMSPDHAPVVKLKIPRQQLQFVLKRGLDVHISSNQAASATLRLMLPAAAAKALGVRKRPVTLATVTVRLRTGKMVALRLVLSRRARRHLRNRKIVTVTLTAAVTGPGGKTSLSRRLVLRRSTRHATASGLAHHTHRARQAHRTYTALFTKTSTKQARNFVPPTGGGLASAGYRSGRTSRSRIA